MVKRPKLAHVRYVKGRRPGQVYAYFNTGRTRNGSPVLVRLPDPSSAGFFDSYAACLGHRNRTTTRDYTVADLVKDYQASKTFSNKSDGTRETYNSALLKVVQEFGEAPVNQLERRDIQFVMENAGWGPATCNLVRAVLSAVFAWGRENDKTTNHPTADMKKDETGSHEPWPDDMLKAGLASDDATIRLAVHLLYFTGQRISDVVAMRWGNVSDDGIAIRQGKTGKRMTIPFIDELRAELDRTPKRGLLILDGMKVAALRRKLQAFTKALGVETVPHGLRKNAVNALLEAGCTVGEVAAITGQSWQMVEHYAARVNQKKLGQAAIVKLEAHRKLSA